MTDPILPRSAPNPVGQADRIADIKRLFKRDLRDIRDDLIEQLLDIPVKVRSDVRVNQSIYEYLISPTELARLILEFQNRLNETLGEEVAEALRQAALNAYQQGTAQAVENLIRITDGYTRTIAGVLRSRPYQRRAALVGARAFENMHGFSDQTGTRLADLLRRAIEDNRNPRAVAADIRRQFNQDAGRALRIARTEITGALRRANWDETDDAGERLGVRYGLLHISARLPTTRRTHAARHGRVYSIQDTRQFYAEDGNGINCRCVQRSVELDENGEPIISERLQKRFEQQREAFVGTE